MLCIYTAFRIVGVFVISIIMGALVTYVKRRLERFRFIKKNSFEEEKVKAMVIYEKQCGVPRFACTEYQEKTKSYVVLIPIINEGERIIKELKRALKYHVF